MAAQVNKKPELETENSQLSKQDTRLLLGRVDEFWRDDVFGIPELNQT
jgi:hypothetical protein